MQDDRDDEEGDGKAEVDVGQEIRGTKTKNIIGVRAGVINGDVTVNQLEVQIYALTEESQRGDRSEDRRLPPEVSPYPGPVPFEYDQSGVYHGRAGLTKKLLLAVDNNEIVLAYGPPASGKTSLFNCGLIPAATQRGAMAVRIEDYGDPATVFATALEEAGLPLDPDERDGSFGSLVEAVTARTEGSLLVVLDQFERVFDLPEPQQARSVATIAELMGKAGRLVRVVVGYSEVGSRAFSNLAGLQQQRPGLLQGPILVDRLTIEEATAAVRQPALIHGGITFSPGLIDTIVADLDELSDSEPGRVEPLDLQIVAKTLFQRAREAKLEGAFPTVDSSMYPGAQELVARHLERSLATGYADSQELAVRILQALSQAEIDPWIAPRDIAADDASRREIRLVLERMVVGGLVARRTAEPFEYSLANPAVRAAVARYTGTAGDERVAAVLDGLWHGWLTEDRRTADARQLRLLANSSYRTEKPAVKVLLVRSAVAARVDCSPWREELLDDPVLVGLAKDPQTPPRNSVFWPLFDFAPVGDDEIGVGALAATAVRSDDRIAADTAAVTLTVVDDHLSRIWNASLGVQGGLRRRARRARAWGAIREAGVDSEEFVALATLDRIGIWADRVRRRFLADHRDLGRTVLAAAVGGGLLFGIFRFLTSFFTTIPKGVDLSVNFFWAFLLVAGAAAGAFVAERTSLRPSRWKSLALGTIGFGGAHALVTVLNGQNPAALRWATWLAFVAGLAVAAMLVDSRVGWPWYRWLLGSVLVAGLFGGLHALIQENAPPISENGPVREAMQVVRNASFYAAELPQSVDAAAKQDPSWFKDLAVIDAAVAGAAVSVGARAGVRLKHRIVTDQTEVWN